MYSDVLTIKYIAAVILAAIISLSATGCSDQTTIATDTKLKRHIKPTSNDKPASDTKQALCRFITAESQAIGLDPILPLAIAEIESSYKIHAKSHAGAVGIFQVMPANAKRCGTTPQYLHGAATNIKCGIKIIKEELNVYDGDIYLMLRAYNGGPKCVKNKCQESEKYVQKITSLIRKKHTKMTC